MARYVLMDIEGTTTPITFVHDVLFPYSTKHLPEYVRDHAADPTVKQALSDTKATVAKENGATLDDAGAVAQLLRWIKEDRKHPALKTLQGLIWRHGYEAGAYTGLIYDDVKPMLDKWQGQGKKLGIYLSGSVVAQKLLFGYTQAGDLTPYFSHYFDTAVGGKREAVAYDKILSELRLPGSDVVFLSDVIEELDAARAAGMKTVQLVRPGTKPGDRHPTAPDYLAVDRLL
jgi:enolase-phosphatase E1